MVTLRIWYPSLANKFGPGSSSVLIHGVEGGAYVSTRPVKQGSGQARRTRTATLADDLEAEGGDTLFTWLFRHLDEGRMLRLWSSMQGNLTTDAETYAPETSFRTSDMILAAGRGIDVEDNSSSAFAARARGRKTVATLAPSCGALGTRADNYLEVEHW